MKTQNINIGWNQEIDELNNKYFPIFIYASILGILSYSVFDFYLTPNLWLTFLIFRIFISLFGLTLLYFINKTKFSSQIVISLFLIFMYTFFSIGASLLETKNQLIAWNLSIVVAGLFWPHFILVVKKEVVFLINLFFLLSYIIAYYFFSIFDLKTLIVQGGVFFMFGIIASYFISFSRYKMHYSNFKLKHNLLISNTKLEKLNTELQESNRVKDRFFSIVAHDLKAPFNGILGFSNILIETLKNRNIEEAESYALIIQKSSKKYFSFLTNLLEWSRAQSQDLNIQLEKIVLSDLCDDIILLLNPISDEKQISVINKIQGNIVLDADKQMLATILRNLITNAIKFSYENSDIELNAEMNKNETNISIKDNGVGMNNETLNKLFKIEFTESSKGTKNEEGHGLGLFVCKEFVEKHNGKISVISKVGKGTKFTFSIPLHN